ncbi:MAG: hypothetical protein DRJ98_08580, partial [Thermoprotei archaeon]
LGGAFSAPVFDLSLLDVLPDTLGDLQVLSIETSGAQGVEDHSTPTMLNVTAARLEPGGWINVTFRVILQPNAVFGERIVTTGIANGTSLPGDRGSGNYTPGVPGAINGERIGSGVAPNWIRAEDTASVTVGIPNVEKDVITPQARYSVGDVVKYMVTVGTPKGSTELLIVVDTLSDGLSYINQSLHVELPNNVAVGNTPSNSSPFFTHVDNGVTEQLTFNFSSFTNYNSVGVNTYIFFDAIVEDNPIVVDGRLLNNSALLTFKAKNGSLISVGPATVSILVGEPKLGSEAKTADPNTGITGSIGVIITLSVKNEGTTTAYDVVLTDVLPEELRGRTPSILSMSVNGRTLGNSDYSYTYTASNGTLKITLITNSKNAPARVEPGEIVIAIFTAYAVDHVPLSKEFTNTFIVEEYSSQPGKPDVERVYSGGTATADLSTANPTVRKEVYSSRTPPLPDAQVDKTRNKAIVGETITYNVTFVMPRGTVAYDVNFTDRIPDGLKVLDVEAWANNASGRVDGVVNITETNGRWVVNVSFGDLYDAIVTVLIRAEVCYNYSTNEPVKAGDVLINSNASNPCFFLWSNGVETKRSDTNPTYTEILWSYANLTVVKYFDPPSVYLGTNATFYIRVVNKGNGTAYNVKVVDGLGPSFRFVDANVTPSVSGNKLVWDVGRIDPGEDWGVKVVVVPDNCTGFYDNVTVYWVNPEEPGVYHNSTAWAELDIIPELEVTKDVVKDVVESSETTPVVIKVRNPSCGYAYHINLTDFMPFGFIYVNGTSEFNGTPIGDPDVVEGKLVWNLSVDLAPGDWFNLTFTMKATPNSVTDDNVVRVRGRDKHYVPLYYVAKDKIKVLRPKISIAKDVYPEETYINGSVWVTITVHNYGDASAYHIVLKDVIPPGTEYVSDSSELNNEKIEDPEIDGRKLTWNLDMELKPGKGLILRFRLKVKSLGEKVNVAYVYYYDKEGYPYGFKKAEDDFKVLEYPS